MTYDIYLEKITNKKKYNQGMPMLDSERIANEKCGIMYYYTHTNRVLNVFITRCAGFLRLTIEYIAKIITGFNND